MFTFSWKEMNLSHKYNAVPDVPAERKFCNHYHDFYEIFYFISGTALYTVENEKRPLNPGDALIINPGYFHSVEFADDSPYERYVLKVPSGFIPAYIAEKLERRSPFFPAQSEAIDIFARLDRAYKLFEGNDMYYYGGAIAAQAAIYLCANGAEADESTNLAGEDIKNILNYINENIEKPLTMSDIAANFHFSSDYLSRKFYQYMKTPIMKYVRTKRILAAKKMLITGIKPTQAAEILGFSDYSTFYRSYISVTGKSPSDDPAATDALTSAESEK